MPVGANGGTLQGEREVRESHGTKHGDQRRCRR
ncbi:hypothetical protein ABIB17_002374 [Arthrobacter sp. UYEF6]